MNEILEFIGITGDDYLPDEIFIGGCSGGAATSATTATITPISEDEALADALWEGQNEKITHETAYCDQLQQQFREKLGHVSGVKSKLVDVIQEVTGELLGELANTAVNAGVTAYTHNAAAGALAGWLAGIATELTLEWGLEYLIDVLKQGNALLDGIKAENSKLLQLEKSRENYEYRESVLARHREDIQIVLDQIRDAGRDATNGISVSSIQPDNSELLQAIRDLRFNNTSVQLPSNIRFNSAFRTIQY